MDIGTSIIPLEKSIAASGETSLMGGLGASRWGHVDNKPYLPPPFVDLPQSLTLTQSDQLLREQRLEELNRKLLINDFEIGDPDIRPPSPLPIYDRDGNRTNTREIRMKAAMTNEQQKLIEHMIATVPGYVAPTEFRAQKRVRRLLIPQDEFPEYNFMGLIIGPRGVNHKRLESESGAQISIRGKGTQKEGKRSDHQTDEEANMPQHVHIAADTDEKLQKAVSLIEPLLDPSHPIHEEFKKKGLEQLAMVNGMGGNFIARNDAVCTVCGQMGHYGFDCPETRFETYDHADVQCLLCGDRGHVTMDCKIAKDMNLTPAQIQAMRMDSTAGKTSAEISDALLEAQAQSNEYRRIVGVDMDPPPPPPPSMQGRSGIGFIGADNKNFHRARDGSFRPSEITSVLTGNHTHWMHVFCTHSGAPYTMVPAGDTGVDTNSTWYPPYNPRTIPQPMPTAPAPMPMGHPMQMGMPMQMNQGMSMGQPMPMGQSMPMGHSMPMTQQPMGEWNDVAAAQAQAVLSMMNAFQQQQQQQAAMTAADVQAPAGDAPSLPQ